MKMSYLPSPLERLRVRVVQTKGVEPPRPCLSARTLFAPERLRRSKSASGISLNESSPLPQPITSFCVHQPVFLRSQPYGGSCSLSTGEGRVRVRFRGPGSRNLGEPASKKFQHTYYPSPIPQLLTCHNPKFRGPGTCYLGEPASKKFQHTYCPSPIPQLLTCHNPKFRGPGKGGEPPRPCYLGEFTSKKLQHT